MGIGGSDGAYYEDGFDHLTNNDGNKPEGDDAKPKGSRSPSDVNITFRNPNPNPAGTASSGGRSKLNPDDPGVLNPDTDSNPHITTQDWNEITPNQGMGLQWNSKNMPTPETIGYKGIEDRQDWTPLQGAAHLVGDTMMHLPAAAEDLFRNPAGQSTPPETPLGDQLGMKNIPEAGQSWIDRLSMVNAFKGMLHPSFGEDINQLKGFYEGVKNLFTLPGEVFGGKIDPMSKQGIEKAADMANTMVFGPRPVAAKMADGTLGSFAGLRSLRTPEALASPEANATMVRQHMAQRMEQDGLSKDLIWQKTGWMRGVDNRWRYEIDDSQAKFDPNWHTQETLENKFGREGIAIDTRYGSGGKDNSYSLRKWKSEEPVNPNDLPENLKDIWNKLITGKMSAPLSDIWDHPELYKAYPELKDIQVLFDPKEQGAHFDPGNQTITLGGKKGSKGYNFNSEGTLAHEVQHVIQGIEGFAKGGARGEIGEQYNLKLQQDYEDFQKEAKTRLPAIDEKYAKKGALGLTDDDLDFITKYNKVMSKWADYMQAGKEEAHENYERLAGEVEARNTSTRLAMTAKERRLQSPIQTHDTPTFKQKALQRPVYATAYGYQDEYGAPVKSQDNVTNFRRPANDNFPEGDPRRPYNPQEPDMIGSKEHDDAIDRMWARFGEQQRRLAEIQPLIDKPNKTELDFARIKKMQDQYAKDFPD